MDSTILEAVCSGAQDYFVKHRLNAGRVRDALERIMARRLAKRSQTLP